MKKTIALLMALCMLFALCACGQKTSAGAEKPAAAETAAEESAPASEQLHFTFVSPLVSHEYWQMVEAGVLAGAEEQGVDVNVLGETKVDVEAMVKFIDTAIASKVDGIITMALSPAALQPAIDRAVEAGIPVVLLDTDAPESLRSAYVGTSNYDAGFEAGKAMVEATGGKAEIGIIRGTLGQETDNDRIKGFEDAIAESSDMKVVAVEACDSDMLTATQKMQDMLKAYPSMTAVFGSEGTGAVAAGKVLTEQNRVGDITVIGFDDTAECLDYIRNGVVYGTIVQKPYYMGEKCVELLVRINKGETIEEPVIDSGVTLVTVDNVESYK